MNLRIMVFSGDDDSICGTVGTQSWIYNYWPIKSGTAWKAWELEGQVRGGAVSARCSSPLTCGRQVTRARPHAQSSALVPGRQVAGYVEKFDGLTFATVHGAGENIDKNSRHRSRARREREKHRPGEECASLCPLTRALSCHTCAAACLAPEGHEVPTYKPAQALKLIGAYFNGSSWLF